MNEVRELLTLEKEKILTSQILNPLGIQGPPPPPAGTAFIPDGKGDGGGAPPITPDERVKTSVERVSKRSEGADQRDVQIAISPAQIQNTVDRAFDGTIEAIGDVLTQRGEGRFTVPDATTIGDVESAQVKVQNKESELRQIQAAADIDARAGGKEKEFFNFKETNIEQELKELNLELGQSILIDQTIEKGVRQLSELAALSVGLDDAAAADFIRTIPPEFIVEMRNLSVIQHEDRKSLKAPDTRTRATTRASKKEREAQDKEIRTRQFTMFEAMQELAEQFQGERALNSAILAQQGPDQQVQPTITPGLGRP